MGGAPAAGEAPAAEERPYVGILAEYGVSAEPPYLAPPAEQGRSFTVGTGDCDFASLAEALASEEVAAGSILELPDAEYSERELVVAKSLLIRGTGEGYALIKAKEPDEKACGRIMTVMSEVHLTLENAHLKNGRPVDSLRTGGAICNYGRLTVLRCAFSENAANCGGAIHSERGTLIAVDCRFSGNYADGRNKDGRDCGSGGAVKTQDRGTAILIDCVLTGNRARYKGGAVKTSCLSRTVMINCSITDNTCVATGGGIDSGGPLYVENSTITGNSAQGRKRYSTFAGIHAGSGIYSKGNLFLYNSTVTDQDSHYDVVVEAGSELIGSNNSIGNSEYGN